MLYFFFSCMLIICNFYTSIIIIGLQCQLCHYQRLFLFFFWASTLYLLSQIPNLCDVFYKCSCTAGNSWPFITS